MSTCNLPSGGGACRISITRAGGMAREKPRSRRRHVRRSTQGGYRPRPHLQGAQPRDVREVAGRRKHHVPADAKLGRQRVDVPICTPCRRQALRSTAASMWSARVGTTSSVAAKRSKTKLGAFGPRTLGAVPAAPSPSCRPPPRRSGRRGEAAATDHPRNPADRCYPSLRTHDMRHLATCARAVKAPGITPNAEQCTDPYTPYLSKSARTSPHSSKRCSRRRIPWTAMNSNPSSRRTPNWQPSMCGSPISPISPSTACWPAGHSTLLRRQRRPRDFVPALGGLQPTTGARHSVGMTLAAPPIGAPPLRAAPTLSTVNPRKRSWPVRDQVCSKEAQYRQDKPRRQPHTSVDLYAWEWLQV